MSANSENFCYNCPPGTAGPLCEVKQKRRGKEKRRTRRGEGEEVEGKSSLLTLLSYDFCCFSFSFLSAVSRWICMCGGWDVHFNTTLPEWVCKGED